MVVFLTEQLSWIHVERANLKEDLNEMTAMIQQLKDDIRKALTNVFTELQKIYEDTVDVFKVGILENFVDWWKEIETHFQVGFACLAVCARVELLCRSLDVQSSL